MKTSRPMMFGASLESRDQSGPACAEPQRSCSLFILRKRCFSDALLLSVRNEDPFLWKASLAAYLQFSQVRVVFLSLLVMHNLE